MTAWPITLPQELDQDGYTEKPPNPTIRTSMDAGVAKTRRRFSSGVRPITGTMILTNAERQILDDFYVSDLAHGSLSFDWINPTSGLVASVRFVEPPDYSAFGAAYQVAMKLEILP